MGVSFQDFEADFLVSFKISKYWIREIIIGYLIYIPSILRQLTI